MTTVGRLLGPEDDRIPGAHGVVVLSHHYWTTRFGADPDVIGETLVVNGEPMTIVGVTREDFAGTTTLDRPQIFVPLMMAQQAFRDPDWNGMTARNNHWLYIFGRLRASVTREKAQALLKVPFTSIIRGVELPALRSGMGDRARDLRTMDDQIWDNTARDRVLSTLSSSFALLATLLAAIGLYAVPAYGVAQRLREFGIRMALGARSADVRWLVLAHVARIAVTGGIIGAGLAVGLGWLGRAMLIGVEGYDATVIGGAALLVLVVAFLAGAVPARRATSVNPVVALRAD